MKRRAGPLERFFLAVALGLAAVVLYFLFQGPLARVESWWAGPPAPAQPNPAPGSQPPVYDNQPAPAVTSLPPLSQRKTVRRRRKSRVKPAPAPR